MATGPTALEPDTAAPPAPDRSLDSSRPAREVRRELAHAVGDALLLLPRAASYAARRSAFAREVEELLGAEPPAVTAPVPRALPPRPLSILVSCAEVSGEIHALALVRAIRERVEELGGAPPVFTGLGGARLASADVRLLGTPVEHARMGVRGVSKELPYYLDLLRTFARELERDPPDVFAPVDSPALHVPMARIAQRYKVPVVHFVAPQYWGWAPWRAGAYKDAVDRALTILPFEAEWFRRRGVRAEHVGHPLLDALARVPRAERGDESPRAQRDKELVLLPGSRESVIEHNLAPMLDAAARLRARIGEIPVVVVHDRAELASKLQDVVRARGAEGWARVDARDLHAALRRARAALSVSGTILIDLLHHRLPAVVLYRVSASAAWLSRRALTVPWFSSVNLLAAREVYPEFCFAGDGPTEAIDAALDRAWTDPAWRARCAEGLEVAARRLGPPGAVDRAALHVLDVALGGDRGATSASRLVPEARPGPDARSMPATRPMPGARTAETPREPRRG